MTAITTTHTATVAMPAAIAMEGVPPGYWQDQRGALVPEAKVKDIDKLRHQVVTDLCQMAKASSAALSKFKLDATRDPKQITLYDDGGKLIFRGIYILEGDTLLSFYNDLV